MVSVGSGTTRSGSISICEPSPVQRSHAPCGELNEKIRGSSSGIDGPWSGHANFSEYRYRSASASPPRPPRRPLPPPTPPAPRRPPRPDGAREPLAQVGAHHEPVDHHRDVVL